MKESFIASGIITAMAATLRQYGATGTERDAIRCLMDRGFRGGDIIALAGDALVEARQPVVPAPEPAAPRTYGEYCRATQPPMKFTPGLPPVKGES